MTTRSRHILIFLTGFLLVFAYSVGHAQDSDGYSPVYPDQQWGGYGGAGTQRDECPAWVIGENIFCYHT